VIAAAAGLSVVLATSAVAYSFVKYAGAAYLIYLGINLIVRTGREADQALPVARAKQSPFFQGVLTETLNPKTALFFLSFIPQFVSRQSGHAFAAFVILGLISVTLNTLGDVTAVMLAAPLKQLFARSPRARITQTRASGAAMVALGAYVALSDSQ
jgi:threonine/homoserine/homoserine lactone efflux protein